MSEVANEPGPGGDDPGGAATVQVTMLQRSGGTRSQTIGYREAGPADGRPAVLLHGIGSTSRVWAAQLAALSATHRVIAWDAPGYGASEAFPHPDPIVTDYVLALRGLVDALRLDGVHLVGSSLGALIAAEAAVVIEDRAASLALLAPHVGAGRSDATAEAELTARTAMISPGLATYAETRVPALLARCDARHLAFLRKITLELDASGYLQAAHALACGDLLRVAPHITVPALVCVGSHDTITPRAQHAGPATDRIPDAHIVELEGAGHLLEVEAADEVNAVLGAFLTDPGAPVAPGDRSATGPAEPSTKRITRAAATG